MAFLIFLGIYFLLGATAISINDAFIHDESGFFFGFYLFFGLLIGIYIWAKNDGLVSSELREKWHINIKPREKKEEIDWIGAKIQCRDTIIEYAPKINNEFYAREEVIHYDNYCRWYGKEFVDEAQALAIKQYGLRRYEDNVLRTEKYIAQKELLSRRFGQEGKHRSRK